MELQEQQQKEYRNEHPEEDMRLRTALSDYNKYKGSKGEAAKAARQQLAHFVALLLKRVSVRGNALGVGSSSEAFNSLNSFIDKRLEALVGMLFPWAANPVVGSALNALATGATDFTCKTFVRAGIAAPLIGRFALAVLRCALEQGGSCRQVPGAHLEAVCSCLRMAFKSLDDALRIVASAPNGNTDLSRMDFKKIFQDIATLFRQLYKQVLMCHVGELYGSAVLLAAIQLECSPIMFEASEKWVSLTLINLLKERRWVGDLCSRLYSCQTGLDNITGRSSSEFTGLLQLLKAVLQATELFSHRLKDLPRAAHNLLLMEPDLEAGIPVSLLESLINTLCGENPLSTAHAHKIAFILRICVARHSDWHLTEQLFERQRIISAVSNVLESALDTQNKPKQAAEKTTNSVLQSIFLQSPLQSPLRSPLQASLQADPEAHSWSFFTENTTDAPPMGSLLPNLEGTIMHGGEPKKKKLTEAERRRFREQYAKRVRVGMGADKAPAVEAVARAIVEQEETLLTARKSTYLILPLDDLVRLRQLLETYMPEATGFDIPIDHNRRDNICKGTVTDDGVPQDLMEDAILGEKGTLPNGGPAVPDIPPRIRKVHPGGSASKEDHAQAGDGPAAMQSAAGVQVDKDSVEDKAAMNAKLKQKLAELERLKELKAAAAKKPSQSAESQGTPQNGSSSNKEKRPTDSPPELQASKRGNPSARDARPPNQAAQPSAAPDDNAFSDIWQDAHGRIISQCKKGIKKIYK